MYRFHKEDLINLRYALKLKDEYVLENHSRVDGLEAFVLFLSRLSHPNRLLDNISIFGRSSSMISRIFSAVLEDIYLKHHDKLTTLHQPYISLSKLAEVTNEQCGLRNCIGFIDGTVRPMCRPSYNQQASFNGHKRVHAIKFQGIMLSNGIIGCMHGPYEGRRHDSYLLAESGVQDQLSALPLMPDGTPYCLYGDPAYPLTPSILVPYRGQITPEQQQFNQQMSKIREAVEYGFGKVVTYFSFVDFKKNLKLHLMPIGKIYICAVLLTNCHTCLYGSSMNSLLKSQPPTIEEYLS